MFYRTILLCLLLAGLASCARDRDCPDFKGHEEAQEFFIAQGGPEQDPHRLDNNSNGVACEALIDRGELKRAIERIRGKSAPQPVLAAPAYVTRAELESMLREHTRAHHGYDHSHGGIGGGYDGRYSDVYDHSHPPDHTHYP